MLSTVAYFPVGRITRPEWDPRLSTGGSPSYHPTYEQLASEHAVRGAGDPGVLIGGLVLVGVGITVATGVI